MTAPVAPVCRANPSDKEKLLNFSGEDRDVSQRLQCRKKAAAGPTRTGSSERKTQRLISQTVLEMEQPVQQADRWRSKPNKKHISSIHTYLRKHFYSITFFKTSLTSHFLQNLQNKSSTFELMKAKATFGTSRENSFP
jgi:hypothetical protein